MKNKTIEDREVRRYIWDEFQKDGFSLFYHTDVETRHRILEATFLKFTGYRLIRGRGLVEKNGRGPDEFNGYKDFSHLRSADALTFDINQTIKASRDKMGRWRREEYLKRKESFERRRQELIEGYSREEHLQKWEVQNESTRKRIEEMRRLKKHEQDRKFER